MIDRTKFATMGYAVWVTLGVIYIIGLFIFLPKMHQPVGDSWFYSMNVMDTVKSGRVQFAEAQAAMPVFQVALGALVCKITGGFAFWKLNLLAYVFSFLGVVYTYKFIRLFTKGAMVALLGTLLLIGMPPFMKVSLTFWTDGFYYFGLIFAFYHGARYISRAPDEKKVATISASLVALGFVIAILSRTNALVTYLAFLGFIIFRHRRLKPTLVEWAIHLLPLAAFVGFEAYYKLTDSVPFQAVLVPRIFAHNLKYALTTSAFLPFIWSRVVVLAKWAGYFGALLLPVTLWLFYRSRERWRGGNDARTTKGAAVIIWFILTPLLAITAYILMLQPPADALLPNTISVYGMGFKQDMLPGSRAVLGEGFFSTAKIILVLGAIMLWLGLMGRKLEGSSKDGSLEFPWVMFIASAVFPMLSDIFSDRYLIPLIPLAFVLIANSLDEVRMLPRWTWVFPAALIIGSGLLANEYLGWGRAVWDAIPIERAALDRFDVSAFPDEAIDGGFEFTALSDYSDEAWLGAVNKYLKDGLQWDAQDLAPGVYPTYVYCLYIPCVYDVIIREGDEEAPFAAGPMDDDKWEIIGGSKYKPFPWSEEQVFSTYRRISANP